MSMFSLPPKLMRRVMAAVAALAVLTSCFSSPLRAQLKERSKPVEAPVDPYESARGGDDHRGNERATPRPPAPVDPFETSSERNPSGYNPGPSPTQNAAKQPAQRLELETDCPSTEDLPFEYRRSWAFYLLTQDAKSCSRAVQELRTLSQAFRNSTDSADADKVLGDATFLAEPNNVYARGIVERYVNACSYSLADARAITHLTTQENIQKVRKTIGVIQVRGSKCMATIVAGTLLTARHCFGTAPIDGILPETLATVEFTSIDSTVNFQLRTNLKEALLSPDAREEDWIALRLGDQTPGNMLSLPFAPQLAQRWQPLILISVSGYAQALANESVASSEVVRIDISPKCVIQAREGRFIYHSCQTLRGMSGAPLLTMMGTELAALGVHTGVSSGIGSACSAKLSDKYINYGVVPNVLPREK